MTQYRGTLKRLIQAQMRQGFLNRYAIGAGNGSGIRAMPLVGPPFKDLVDILCESFPDHNKLVTFVRYRLCVDVSRDFVTTGLTLRETAERLIDTLDSKGLLVEFVKLVEKEHPQHQAMLRRIIRELVTTAKPKVIEVDLLKHPLVVGSERDKVVRHLDASGLLGQKLYVGQNENLDIWQFVDWANDPARGGKYKLKLER